MDLGLFVLKKSTSSSSDGEMCNIFIFFGSCIKGTGTEDWITVRSKGFTKVVFHLKHLLQCKCRRDLPSRLRLDLSLLFQAQQYFDKMERRAMRNLLKQLSRWPIHLTTAHHVDM